jgi:lipoprotein NlpI
MWKNLIPWCVWGLLWLPCAIRAGVAEDSLAEAARLASSGNPAAALRLVAKRLRVNPADAPALSLQAEIHAQLRDHTATIADYDKLIRVDAERAPMWFNRRGAARFKKGDIAGSIADFDEAIRRDPLLARSHWQRGLSYFYHGQFAAGARQFELYQTYDSADVENVVWRFLCQARVDGIESARREMLPLGGQDQRIPMMAIDALYRGKADVEDVFAAVEKGNPSAEEVRNRGFYAHLYVGLYFDVNGDRGKARHHILAADTLKIDHYMWDVAHVHAQRFTQDLPEK